MSDINNLSLYIKFFRSIITPTFIKSYEGVFTCTEFSSHTQKFETFKHKNGNLS